MVRRRANGVSRRALADALGVAEGSLFSWEREGHAPRPEIQQRLEAFLAGRPVTLPDARLAVSATEILGFRRRHAWSREKLARTLGVSEATVHGWEKGLREPSPLLRAKLHVVLFGDNRLPVAADKLPEFVNVVGAVVQILNAYESRHALTPEARRRLRTLVVGAMTTQRRGRPPQRTR